mgnify:CR=1 FL=1
MLRILSREPDKPHFHGYCGLNSLGVLSDWWIAGALMAMPQMQDFGRKLDPRGLEGSGLEGSGFDDPRMNASSRPGLCMEVSRRRIGASEPPQ